MMEKELFSNYSIDEKKLREYGFRADGGTLIYTQDLPQEHLRIIITCDRSLTGKIMDLDFGGEYVNFTLRAGYSFLSDLDNGAERMTYDRFGLSMGLGFNF